MTLLAPNQHGLPMQVDTLTAGCRRAEMDVGNADVPARRKRFDLSRGGETDILRRENESRHVPAW